MKKLSFRSFLTGLLAGIMLMVSIPALAESSQTIQAIFGRVKLVVNGAESAEETLLYNGTTYVPLRAAAELLDKEVAWDGVNQIAYLDEKGTGRVIETSAATNSNTPPSTTSVPPGALQSYSGFSEVPDFGAFANIEPYMVDDSAIEGTVIYTYDLLDIDTDIVAQYIDLLKEAGFSLSSVSTNEILLYYKGDLKVALMVWDSGYSISVGY